MKNEKTRINHEPAKLAAAAGSIASSHPIAPFEDFFLTFASGCSATFASAREFGFATDDFGIFSAGRTFENFCAKASRFLRAMFFGHVFPGLVSSAEFKASIDAITKNFNDGFDLTFDVAFVDFFGQFGRDFGARFAVRFFKKSDGKPIFGAFVFATLNENFSPVGGFAFTGPFELETRPTFSFFFNTGFASFDGESFDFSTLRGSVSESNSFNISFRAA